VAAVAILLAVAAAGLQAHGTFSHRSNSAAEGATGAVLAIALSAAEGVALIAFILVLASVRPRRPRKDDEEEPRRLPLPWWAKALGVLLALAALAAPFAVLVSRKPRTLPTRPVVTNPVVGGTGRLTPPHPGPPWPLVAGMALAIAVVLAVTLLSRRRRPAGTPRNQARRLAGLLEALTAGRDALISAGEPREAIIACYAAMERGFAAAGSAPDPADTPAEVLARAAGAGIVRSGSPETLTGLFRRARYSAEPMTSADSGVAATALAQMRADLEDTQTQGAGR